MLTARDALSEKVDLFWADPAFILQRDVNDDDAEYDVYGSKGMKDMANVLRDLMKS